MDGHAFAITPFSTQVDLWLEGTWGRQPLRQVADTYVIGHAEFAVPPGSAEVVISVDGKLFRHPVRLPEGYRVGQERTPILPDDDIPI
ncbi:MAG: hypothetical protein AAF916_12675 [Planctomycetota bacterium]